MRTGLSAGAQAVRIAVTNNPATDGRILGRLVFMMMLPFPCHLELPNCLELRCPAVASQLLF